MPVRTWWLLLALLTTLSLARVAATHRVFSQVYDEPWHVAAGYELLTRGDSAYDIQHPPLARVLFALPFAAVPEPPEPDPVGRGNALLFVDDAYRENLAAARAGNLLFLALAVIAVALWARHLFGAAAGLIAALAYASLPPVLAHAGFATTDISAAATVTLALYALTLLVDSPTSRRALLLAFAIALGMLAKFSFLPYFGASAFVLLLMRRRFPWKPLVGATALACALVWGAYGFDFDTLRSADRRADEIARQLFGSTRIASIPLPAPAYVAGVLNVKRHDVRGHDAFLLGEVRKTGWWYYFPVLLFFKTPIPFLALAIAGGALLARRRPEIVAITAAILAIAMTSSINIGVRHVLPIYAPLTLCAAFAVTHLSRARIIHGALLAWLVVGSAFAHPDYLAWFNGFARHPEEIASDSNLDWGQDVLRLADSARSLGIRHMTVAIFTTAPHDRVGMPPHAPLRLFTPVDDWFAVSEMNLAYSHGQPEVHAWFERLLEGRPYRRIGKSIRLYDLRTR